MGNLILSKGSGEAEMRDSFSSEQYGDKTYDLKSISEFEREVF